jgi:DNA polymerase-3 subunit alpha
MFPLLNKTHFSLREAFSKPDTLVKATKDRGFSSCGLIDNGSVSGAVEFSTECKKASIKAIIGCDFSYKKEKDSLFPDYSLYVIAKNLKGWKKLIKLVTMYNKDGCFEAEETDDSNLIVISSNPVYLLSESSFKTEDVAISPSYYISPEDKLYYQILRSMDLKSTISELLKNPPELFVEDLSLPTLQSFAKFNQVQLDNLAKIDSMCEAYSILQDPKLPHFACPNGMSEIDYLTELCRNGWKQFIKSKVPDKQHQEYADRVKQELKVIGLAHLSGYFLIVWDFIKYARDKGVLVGPGRGCFLPDTRVKMSDGNYCPISHISIGDLVIDAYGQSQEVYDTLEYDIEEEIIELEFANGKVIRCTSDHKFLTSNRGWVEAGKLEDYDDIVEV